jgi:hypothetical protein
MANFLDAQDALDLRGDIIISGSQRYKIYNLLVHHFPESSEITLPLDELVRNGVDSEAIINVINAYLTDFNAQPRDFEIDLDNTKGNLNISIKEVKF